MPTNLTMATKALEVANSSVILTAPWLKPNYLSILEECNLQRPLLTPVWVGVGATKPDKIYASIEILPMHQVDLTTLLFR